MIADRCGGILKGLESMTSLSKLNKWLSVYLVFPGRCFSHATNSVIDINDMKSANDMTVLLVYWSVVGTMDTPSPRTQTKMHTSTKRNEGEARREREIDKASLRPLICPQKSCLFRGNDTCGPGGNDQLGPM